MLGLALLHHLGEPLHHLGSLWLKKELVFVSSPAMAAMSVSSRVKSKTSIFCSMRSLCTDLGITTTPRWMFQRSITWAVDLPWRSAISVSTGFWKRPPRPSPKGAQASGCTSYFLSHSMRSTCWFSGWVSIWFTMGLTSLKAQNSTSRSA